MNRFKRIEELNMEVTAEPTVEEMTQVFRAWVNEKINVCEMHLNIDISDLDYNLSQRELMRNSLFNNKFEVEYSCINSFMEEAEWKCEEAGISDDVLDDAIEEFKQMKSKMRKVKVEYKQKFAELREAIRVAKENKEYVDTVASQVEELITDWCSTYVILACHKAEFEGNRLAKTIAYVTDWILSEKLNPSGEDVATFVERFMSSYTEKVAC